MKIFRAYILIVLFLIPVSLNAQNKGQANPDDDKGWMAFGLGTAVNWDFSYSVNLNYGRELFFQGAFHRVENISFGSDPNHINAISLGIGSSKVSRFGRLAFSPGLSFVFGKNYNDRLDKNSKFTSIGLLLNTQATFTPIKEVGMGLDMFMNLNKEEKFAGVVLTVFIEGNK
ncbi:MAG: hypothetical protein GF313_04305 [Caldithrix sp.]|nr:hypothetical protein [Caldithrix sp.]